MKKKKTNCLKIIASNQDLLIYFDIKLEPRKIPSLITLVFLSCWVSRKCFCNTSANVFDTIIFKKSIWFYFLTESKCTSPYVSIDSRCYYFSSEKASWNKAYVSLQVYLLNILWYCWILLVDHLLYEMIRIKWRG